MTALVQNLEYKLSLNGHPKIMLAWRSGLAVEEDFIHVTFNKEIRSDERSIRGRFTHFDTGLKLDLAVDIDGQFVKTALGDGLFSTQDANLIVSMLEGALAINRNAFTLSDIVELRKRYLESNGALSKDHFRREISKKAGTAERSLSDVNIDLAFFAEVKELRGEVRRLVHQDSLLRKKKAFDAWKRDNKLDKDVSAHTLKTQSELFFLSDEYVGLEKDAEHIKSLARHELTKLVHETPDFWVQEWESWKESPEYEQSQQASYDVMREAVADDIEDSEFWRQVALAQRTLPSERAQVESNAQGKRVLIFPNARVVLKTSQPDDAGWYYLCFEESSEFFTVGTKFKEIFDSYEEQSTGLSAIDYGTSFYLMKQ